MREGEERLWGIVVPLAIEGSSVAIGALSGSL